LKTLDELSAASFEHRGQNDRNFEALANLASPITLFTIIDRLVTVKVRELKRLVIDQDNDAFLRFSKAGKPR